MKVALPLSVILVLAIPSHANNLGARILFEDGFANLPPGMFSAGVIGAKAEYHYYRELAPKQGWAVSCFRSEDSQRAWRVIGPTNQRVMYQCTTLSEEERKSMHLILCAGDETWKDYRVSAAFSPEDTNGLAGIVFRYRNDRCYYFFGVERSNAVLKMVNHEKEFRVLNEKTLASSPLHYQPGQELRATVELTGNQIRARLDQKVELLVTDSTFPTGKIGVLADIPTKFYSVVVTTSEEEYHRIQRLSEARAQELKTIRSTNPPMKLWKKIKTPGFGSGRSVRFADLDGDGQIDILIGQVKNHGPKDRNSELSCLTAINLEGKVLWQIGEPDPWNDIITCDVAFQIHDIDRDSKPEVVYCMNFELVIADGKTGTPLRKIPTPLTPTDNKLPYNRFPRILGDSILFCDISGKGYPTDIVLKDRYRYVWVFNSNLELLWHASCNTGHYPFAYDIDGDGRDELLVGYTLFSSDGKRLWSLDSELRDHADGVIITKLRPEPDAIPVIFWAASDEGAIFANLQGKILKHHRIGHVQNPTVADFRSDLPGLEIATINFWGNQGIVHIFDSNGELVYDFEPCQHGSMMLPVNWTGFPPEYLLLSPSVIEGGLLDAFGRCVVEFPNDGHPETCCAALNIIGDARDEIIVWDSYEMWIYTQADNPTTGKIYSPRRNLSCNQSNYQVTHSYPAWQE